MVSYQSKSRIGVYGVISGNTFSYQESFALVVGIYDSVLEEVSGVVEIAGLLEKVEKLRKYLYGDIEAQKVKEEKENTLPKEIIIHYKRKGRNEYRTWGEFWRDRREIILLG